MAPSRRLGLVLFALVAAVGLRAASAAAPAAATAAPLMAQDVAMGNPKAKVTVVEYGSAACPHCAHFNNDIFPAFKAKYVDTGKVRYVFREMLTPPEQFAGTAFLMARCAGEAKYFEVLDDVFHQQDAIYQSGDLAGGLLKIGQKYGMDKDRLNGCMNDKTLAALDARVQRANKDGVDATPTFVIGGNKMAGVQSMEQLSDAIDPLLAK